MKKLCKENNIQRQISKFEKKKQVINFINNNKLPLVVKADGLQLEKGLQFVTLEK